MEKFFVEWLQQHGEKSVVADDTGVGIEGNALRMRAAVYEVKQLPPRGNSVELEFRIALPSGEEIVEFLAGIGDSEEVATKDCLANFVLTTFHPIYKAFINPNDPHQIARKVSIEGSEREMIQGDLYTRGDIANEGQTFQAMTSSIREFVSKRRLDARPHWIKVVYGQHTREPTTVAVTLDNKDDAELTEKVMALPWPSLEQFYLAKQFLVIK